MAGIRGRPGLSLRSRRQPAGCLPWRSRRSSAESVAEPIAEPVAESVAESDIEAGDRGAGDLPERAARRKSGPSHGATLRLCHRRRTGESGPSTPNRGVPDVPIRRTIRRSGDLADDRSAGDARVDAAADAEGHPDGTRPSSITRSVTGLTVGRLRTPSIVGLS